MWTKPAAELPRGSAQILPSLSTSRAFTLSMTRYFPFCLSRSDLPRLIWPNEMLCQLPVDLGKPHLDRLGVIGRAVLSEEVFEDIDRDVRADLCAANEVFADYSSWVMPHSRPDRGHQVRSSSTSSVRATDAAFVEAPKSSVGSRIEDLQLNPVALTKRGRHSEAESHLLVGHKPHKSFALLSAAGGGEQGDGSTILDPRCDRSHEKGFAQQARGQRDLRGEDMASDLLE